MQQLNLHDVELYLEGNHVIALGCQASNAVIVFDTLRADPAVINTETYPVVYDGKHFTVEYHPAFDQTPALLEINCDLTVGGKVPMVIQPGLLDFMVKYLKNPVSMEIGIHEQRHKADKETIRQELIHFVMQESQRYNEYSQAIIVKMLRLLLILGDVTTFKRLDGEKDGKKNYLLYGDKQAYQQAVLGVVGLLLGRFEYDGHEINWWTFPIRDAQPVGTKEMHEWCVTNGFKFIQ